MLITKDIEIVDLGLFLKKENILVIADTHIGYEESLNKQGILIPWFQFRATLERLKSIIDKLSAGRSKPESQNSKARQRLETSDMHHDNETSCKGQFLSKIVINGDIKHEFGTISEQEWRHTLKLLDFLNEYTSDIVLINGNHDTILEPIAKKRGIKVKEYLIVDDVLIIHGDRLNKKIADVIRDNRIKKIIIGHEHPALSLAEGSRVEKYKCFLKGRWKNKMIIVQPSFNLVTEGTDVLKDSLLSPFLKQDLGRFESYIVAEEFRSSYSGDRVQKGQSTLNILYFGKLRDLMAD